jgi:hypothetical protein
LWDNADYAFQMGYFYGPFKTAWCYLFIMNHLQFCVFVTVLNLVLWQDEIAMLIAPMSLNTLYVAFILFVRPYESRLDNILEAVFYTICAFGSGLGLLQMHDPKNMFIDVRAPLISEAKSQRTPMISVLVSALHMEVGTIILRARVCTRVRVWLQAMTWVNLLTMCIFLGNAATGVVAAILAVLGLYPKATAAGDEDSLDEAWVEGSSVPDEFHVSRPVQHWRHGYGFAFGVNHSEKEPFLVCFASGFAKRCALLPHLPEANSFAYLCNQRSHGLPLCLPDIAGTLRRS